MISIDEIIRAFRGALVALVPFFEKVHLPWKEGEAYDEWDGVASLLFNSFVVETLRDGVDADSADFAVADYDMEICDYSGLAFIEVRHSDQLSDQTYALVRFGTDREPLDSVQCATLSEHLVRMGEVAYAISDVRFMVRLPGAAQSVSDIPISKA